MNKTEIAMRESNNTPAHTALTEKAAAMVNEIFNGAIPENVTFHDSGLNVSKENVIHLEIKDNDNGYSHQFDIPLDLPKECFQYLPEMLLAPTEPRQFKAIVEYFLDEEFGYIPFLRYRY